MYSDVILVSTLTDFKRWFMIKLGLKFGVRTEKRTLRWSFKFPGFDDKVNILGLVTGTNKPLEDFFISSPFEWVGLTETEDLFDRERLT